MVNEIRKAILVAMALSAVLAACAPAQQSPDQIQAQVATSVAATVGAQGAMAAAVAATLTAQAPAAMATPSPTEIVLNLPTAVPNLATVTPFVVVPSGGGGGGSGNTTAQYACSWTEVKPKINMFKPGDPIDVVWIITNTGTKAWPSKKDLDYVNGTKFSPFRGQELPPLKPGEKVTVSFEGNAPLEKGFYGMQFKVEGGLCWPAINIEVGKPKDP
jgi:hypothetical protein